MKLMKSSVILELELEDTKFIELSILIAVYPFILATYPNTQISRSGLIFKWGPLHIINDQTGVLLL